MIHLCPVRPSRLLVVLIALAGAAGGCKSAGVLPPIEGVRTAEQARPTLLASLSVAPVDRVSGDVDTLARTLGLPFAGKELLSMLAAQQQLDPATLEQLDTARPIGAAFVAGAQKGEALMTVALPAKKGAADKLIAALGKVGEKQRGASKVARPDGSTLWVAAGGDTVFSADSVEALVAAAALAGEAQRPPTSDVVVTFFPDAFARWQGTDVRTALAEFRKGMLEEMLSASQKRGGPTPGPAERLMYETTVDLMLEPLGETASGALVLDLDPAKGLRVGVRLHPRSGSTFAKEIATPSPYAVDPALFAAGEAEPLVAVWALGPSPYWMDFYAKVLAAQSKAGVRGAAEVGKHLAALRPSLTGAASGTLRVQKAGLSNEFVLPLKGGAPAVVLDGLASALTSRGFTELLGEIYGKAAPQVRARREQNVLRSELAFPVRDRPGDVGTALKAFFGTATLASAMTVSGGRLLGASEPAAASRLTAMSVAAPARGPSPEVAAALAETKGQDALLYMDLWGVMKPAMGMAMPAGEAQAINMVLAMPGFAQLKLPVVFSYRGGGALESDLRIPLSTLTNAANVVRPFIGAGGPR